jgi:tRNA nucleotidyltransferase (CCA-adding enzyme)
MKIQLPEFAINIIEKLKENSFEAFIVGGAVRDVLLGRIVYDWDFATNATPEEIMKIFPDGYYNNDFGTVGIVHESSDKPFEITTYRKESGYTDARHPDKVEWGKSLEEDVSRRDFTINAMALKLISAKGTAADCELVDYHDGKKDLDDKLIRTVGDPNERFSEDALRMMRAIRIATEIGFNIEDETLEAINRNAGLIGKIAKERIKVELFKLLSSPNPDEGILLFRKSGLLEEILPELEKTFGVEQKSPGRHHVYDVGTHLLMSLKNCKSTDPVTRFATLIHDIGKPSTYKKLGNDVITFYNHEMVSTKIAENIADRLKLSAKEKTKLLTLVRWHQFTVDERQTDSAIRRFIKNVGVENINDMIDLRTADRLGGGATETSWRTEEFKKRIVEVQKQPFSVNDLKIDGNDVMKELNLKPGPIVGKILEELFQKVVTKEISNEKEPLIQNLSENIKSVVVGIISKKSPEGIKYLLMSSKTDFGKYTGYYYPPGGHLEKGENEKQALIRELKEELGITINPTKEVTVSPGDVPNQITHWWTCEADTENIKIQKEEVSEIKWFSESEIESDNKIWPATKNFFKEFITK